MKISFSLLAILSLAGIVNANAASIDFSDRVITNSVDNTNYQASWNAQTSAISSRSFSDINGALLNTGSGGFGLWQVSFYNSSTTDSWSFKLAPDAGLGGELYIDGNKVGSNTNDMWWGGNSTNTSQMIISTGANLSVGEHTMTLYYAEVCCNGPVGAWFSTGGNYQNLSVANLNAAATPLPAAVFFVAPALAGVFGFSRRKAAKA